MTLRPALLATLLLGGCFANPFEMPSPDLSLPPAPPPPADLAVPVDIACPPGEIYAPSGCCLLVPPDCCHSDYLLPCGGRCVDVLGSDSANCGACGRACPPGASCSRGRCQCASPLTSCDGQCVDTMSDRHNCGACGVRCDDECNQGHCCNSPAACGARIWCGIALGCVCYLTDSSHCGDCATACPPGKTCQLGVCR